MASGMFVVVVFLFFLDFEIPEKSETHSKRAQANNYEFHLSSFG